MVRMLSGRPVGLRAGDFMTAGLLIAGDLHQVPGLSIIPPASHGGPGWNELDPGDYAVRRTAWIRQIIPHTTGGHWPQPVITGAGPRGHAEQVAKDWAGRDRPAGDGPGKRVHSGAPILVDFDGVIYCLVDLARCAAYHAEGSNGWSVGIEMCTRGDGGIYTATLDATVALIDWLTDWFAIPRQMPQLAYPNRPLRRMEEGAGAHRHNIGGPDCVGVFGHRANTSERGRGDPGDAIFERLAARGYVRLDYDRYEDIELGKRRQAALNARGARLVVDGVLGPASDAAMRAAGFERWSDVA